MRPGAMALQAPAVALAPPRATVARLLRSAARNRLPRGASSRRPQHCPGTCATLGCWTLHGCSARARHLARWHDGCKACLWCCAHLRRLPLRMRCSMHRQCVNLSVMSQRDSARCGGLRPRWGPHAWRAHGAWRMAHALGLPARMARRTLLSAQRVGQRCREGASRGRVGHRGTWRIAQHVQRGRSEGHGTRVGRQSNTWQFWRRTATARRRSRHVAPPAARHTQGRAQGKGRRWTDSAPWVGPMHGIPARLGTV